MFFSNKFMKGTDTLAIKLLAGLLYAAACGAPVLRLPSPRQMRVTESFSQCREQGQDTSSEVDGGDLHGLLGVDFLSFGCVVTTPGE
ncbi:hypothetical protein JX265_010662 [Neoarthrinium moseri]|uniref:Uncharacterized protein n=1 Tax=Neoarthrinium moseri TaxID=1658444 RepID=A0A9Q0AI53_9PEZI|nr:uncharacterized protein JN550_007175 [Neoarthrinium moseri]KAI1858569.1 hypothetical protein JX265_010662 [Neoarthrinium moseri]KAI1867123.1 hypothetical protein JN550_007175 [Neoarthrinium moseri]